MFRGKVKRYQTRVEFWQTMVAQDALHGNAYALIQKNGRGEIIGLMPLMSGQMEVSLEQEGGAVKYKYNNGNEIYVFAEEQIWHLKSMGNGIIGYSSLSFGRNSIGIGLAAEGRVTKIFSNGGKPAGVLTTNEVLKDDQRARVKQNFKDMTEGTEDTLFVLEHGFDYKQISMSPKDIELLSSRSFQLKDVCRYFGVPSVLINDMDSTTTWGSGIQEIIEGFYKFTIRPYLERYEASINCILLKPAERDNITAEFDFNALLRADMEKRFRTYKEAIMGGFMSPNEARKEEGYEPKEGGDELFMQQQNVPITMLQELHAAQTKGAAT
jgi:HK97 family phage portal protein